jgi:hypothetical protein
VPVVGSSRMSITRTKITTWWTTWHMAHDMVMDISLFKFQNIKSNVKRFMSVYIDVLSY